MARCLARCSSSTTTPAFRDLATRVLVGWGHEVIGEAGSVEEALARAAELRPDTALVDIGLPDGDGFALAAAAACAAVAACGSS